MLVITRRLDETVLIGDDIKVTIVGIKKGNDKINIGIEAPKGMQITRKELFDDVTSNSETMTNEKIL